MTQPQQLLAHFKRSPTITNVEANAILRIRALPRRISDLEEMGYAFSRERLKDSTGQRYVRYTFIGKKVQELVAA